jgi:RNA polymerase sigma factor (sigma-70 family)
LLTENKKSFFFLYTGNALPMERVIEEIEQNNLCFYRTSLMEQTEEEIIKACVRGDRTAQSILYHQYASNMLAVCRLYANDTLEAEDMFQEAFVKIFDAIGTYRFQGSFKGWMRRIVVNVALNTIRSRNKNVQYTDTLPDLQSTQETAIDQCNHKDILKALDQLPTGYKMVFNLFVIEGYSHAEIAEQLGIKEATSRSQLNKARKYLQHLLTSIDTTTS